MKKISFLFVLFVGFFFFVGCLNKKVLVDNWVVINEEKKIVIGLDDIFVFMGFRDKDGKFIGFDIDLVKVVFE